MDFVLYTLVNTEAGPIQDTIITPKPIIKLFAIYSPGFAVTTLEQGTLLNPIIFPTTNMYNLIVLLQ